MYSDWVWKLYNYFDQQKQVYTDILDVQYSLHFLKTSSVRLKRKSFIVALILGRPRISLNVESHCFQTHLELKHKDLKLVFGKERGDYSIRKIW